MQIRCNPEAEKQILGYLLNEHNEAPYIFETLKTDHFYKELHQDLFSEMKKCFDKGESINAIVLSEKFNPSFIAMTMNSACMGHQVETLCNNIYKNSNHRKLIALLNTCRHEAETAEEPEEVINKLGEGLSGIVLGKRDSYILSAVLMDRVMANIEGRKEGTISTGIPTGFEDLDQKIHGWQKQHLVFLGAVPKMGKCLGKGTKVLMFDGSLKNVESVCAGELLMGPDSKLRTVLSTSQGKEQMYLVRQSNGIDYRVNESHILSLKKSKNYSGPCTPGELGDVINISISDYLKRGARFKLSYKGYKVGVDFSEKELPIEPYYMGLWLGDGRSSDSKIYTVDSEIKHYMEQYAAKLGLTVKEGDRNSSCCSYIITSLKRLAPQHNLNSIKSRLRKLQVLGNKHIPTEYLINSKSNRLALLAGLIDSDGYYNRNHNGNGSGPYEITLKSKKLIKQIKFLCDSLGYRTNVTEKLATIKSIGYSCKVYRLIFNGNVDEIPVLLQRKKANKWTRNDNWTLSKIKIEKDTHDEYFGFEISGDGLFLLEDMTVTHNTALALEFANNLAKHNFSALYFTLEMSLEEMGERQLSSVGEIRGQAIATGRIRDDQINNVFAVANRIADYKMGWVDRGGISVTEIKSICRQYKAKHGLDFVVIDQLDKIEKTVYAGENDANAMKRVTTQLKSMAQELDCTVLCLCQLLDKVVSARPIPRPQHGDEKGSSAPSEDADIVMFLWRPEFYFEGMHRGMAELIIARQRTGPAGAVWFTWRPEITKFNSMPRAEWPKEIKAPTKTANKKKE